VRILKKDNDKRAHAEVIPLIPYFKQIEFFKAKEIKDAYFLDIVNALKYQEMSKGGIIFNHGKNSYLNILMIGDYGD
jgi:hypothetical protein